MEYERRMVSSFARCKMRSFIWMYADVVDRQFCSREIGKKDLYFKPAGNLANQLSFNSPYPVNSFIAIPFERLSVTSVEVFCSSNLNVDDENCSFLSRG